jgi:threonyl-tRNA synthetase
MANKSKPKSREEIVKGIQKKHLILTPEGEEILIDLDKVDELKEVLEKLDDDALQKYIWSEELKNIPREEPPSIKAMQRQELIDYEPAADSGHFRFYPKGAIMYDLLIDWAYEIAVKRFGAMKIETPLIYDWGQEDIREQGKSFHERHYVVKVEDNKDKKWVLRFAGDFGLFKMLKDSKMSYKNLPVRIYELSKSFRYEKRGELAGLRRLRGFTMPDVHSFCKGLDSGWEEFKKLYMQYDDLAKGTDVEYALVFRVVDEFYEKHKKQIIEMLKYSNRPAFIEVLDKMKHYWAVKWESQGIDSVGGNCQLSTVQLDVVDAERYGIVYNDKDGKEKGCTICHSSIGAIERWLFSILENALKNEKPTIPIWLSPSQVRLIPVANSHLNFCEEICKELNDKGIRCDIEDREMTLGKKIRETNREWIPYVAVVGDKELESKKLQVNFREDDKKEEMTKEELMKEVEEKTKGMPKKDLWLPKLLSQRQIFYG